MDILVGTTEVLTTELVRNLQHYRHRVFIEMLGWDLDCAGPYEKDEFDRADTIYAVCRNEAGQIVGSGRLLPTLRPYLLADVFPELMGGASLPHSENIWELSRFAAVNFDNECVEGERAEQLSSSVAIQLLQAILDSAAKLGAHRIITVSPLGIERLLRHAGFLAHRASAPVKINNELLFACWIEILGKGNENSEINARNS